MNTVMNNMTFKGYIHVKSNDKLYKINTNKISNIREFEDGTSIRFEHYNKDFKTTRMTSIKVPHDINTILNAYNATKNKKLTVELL